jgi:hypothetical protein
VQLQLETEKIVPVRSLVHGGDGACGDDDDSSQVQLPGNLSVHDGGDACGGSYHGLQWGPIAGLLLPSWQK